MSLKTVQLYVIPSNNHKLLFFYIDIFVFKKVFIDQLNLIL